jgi:nitrous oxide reductase accessory protein NosL
MRTSIILLALICTSIMAMGQSVPSKSACAHCQMQINNPQFVSHLVKQNGDTLIYDAIECLIAALQTQNDEVNTILVADFSQENKKIEASSATYLQSKNIPSPMGAYLSAYAKKEAAEEAKNTNGGQLYTWEEIQKHLKSDNLAKQPAHHHHHRPDASAPIGVMGDHVHQKGDFMVSLTAMRMNMGGNMSGSDEVSDMAIHSKYMVSPQSMQMQMYMIGAMYAPINKLTVMVMLPYISSQMEGANMKGMGSMMNANGIGDTKISGLYSLVSTKHTTLIANTTVSIATGRISTHADMGKMGYMKLPYRMQVGSGTLDVTLGATLRQTLNKISWGVQPLALIRTSKNSSDYNLGNEYWVNTWAGFSPLSWISFSLRAEGIVQQSINGKDPDMHAMMSPMATASNSGSQKIRTYIGTNISFGENSAFRNLKLGAEYGMPVYQNFTGIQMAEKHIVTLGMKYSL